MADIKKKKDIIKSEMYIFVTDYNEMTNRNIPTTEIHITVYDIILQIHKITKIQIRF